MNKKTGATPVFFSGTGKELNSSSPQSLCDWLQRIMSDYLPISNSYRRELIIIHHPLHNNLRSIPRKAVSSQHFTLLSHLPIQPAPAQ